MYWWMDKWMSGCGPKAGLRIANSNQNTPKKDWGICLSDDRLHVTRFMVTLTLLEVVLYLRCLWVSLNKQAANVNSLREKLP